jgi:hypothetical protein
LISTVRHFVFALGADFFEKLFLRIRYFVNYWKYHMDEIVGLEVDQLIFDWSELQDENSAVGAQATTSNNVALRSFHSAGSTTSDTGGGQSPPAVVAPTSTASSSRIKKLHSRTSTASSMGGWEEEHCLASSGSASASVALMKKLHSRTSTSSSMGGWVENSGEDFGPAVMIRKINSGGSAGSSGDTAAGHRFHNPNPNHNSSMRSIITDLSEDVAVMSMRDMGSNDADDADDVDDNYGEVILNGSRAASPFSDIPSQHGSQPSGAGSGGVSNDAPVGGSSSSGPRLTSSALATASSFRTNSSSSSKSGEFASVPRTSLQRSHSLHTDSQGGPPQLVSFVDANDEVEAGGTGSVVLHGFIDNIFEGSLGDENCYNDSYHSDDLEEEGGFSGAGASADPSSSASVAAQADKTFFGGVSPLGLGGICPPDLNLDLNLNLQSGGPPSISSTASEKRGNSLFRVKHVDPGVRLAPVSRRKRRKMITIPDVSHSDLCISPPCCA